MADWETVRGLALALPEVEEDTSHGEPAFRIRKKLFAWMSPHEQGALVVRVDPDEKPLLLESNPAAYFVTPHYENYPCVLVRMDRIDRDELAERVEDAWLLRAPKRLAARLAETDG